MFRIDPQLFFESEEELDRAKASLDHYQRTYTGRFFDRWIARTDPSRIREADILAVGALSVDVDPEAAAWLLDDAADSITALLTKIPAAANIWNDGDQLVTGGPAEELYWLLYERPGLKRTTVSKLLAAKRPALIPIWDKNVAGALFDGDRDVNDWQLWLERCASPVGDQLRLIVSIANNSRFELLRAMDIAIWMWGDQDLAALPGPGDRQPVMR